MAQDKHKRFTKQYFITTYKSCSFYTQAKNCKRGMYWNQVIRLPVRADFLFLVRGISRNLSEVSM